MKMRNNEWVANLKPGDEVYIQDNYDNGRFSTVEKITPAGNIKAAGYLFDKTGFQRGEEVWRKYILREPTEELRKSHQEKKILRKATGLCEDVERRKIILSVEQAEKIIAIFETKGE
jgi:hypothetical protein